MIFRVINRYLNVNTNMNIIIIIADIIVIEIIQLYIYIDFSILKSFVIDMRCKNDINFVINIALSLNVSIFALNNVEFNNIARNKML